jgi:hypothetical protein
MNAPTLDPEFVARDVWRGVAQRTEANRTSVGRIKDIDPKMAVTFLAIDWFNSVIQFRNEEADFLETGLFDQLLDTHRFMVATLIAQGELLTNEIKKHGLLQQADFTADDLRAAIDSLRETFRGVHGPHNHPQINESIRAMLETA